MNICRNCASLKVQDLGLKGDIALFFLYRVFNINLGLDGAGNPVKKLLRRLPFVPHNFFRKVYRTSALVDLQVCEDCSFIQTKTPFSEDMLNRLYKDYRSDSYNAERIHYEPQYAAIADRIGRSAEETSARVTSLTSWLNDKISPDNDFSMLDYGGADGRFLPHFNGEKYVYEISDVAPVPEVTRINNESSLGNYSYVQLAQLLEHVPNPLQMVKAVATRIRESGYLYVEVPEDLDKPTVVRLIEDKDFHVQIHEHINFYNAQSVSRLIESAGLKVVRVDVESLDLGWAKAKIVRGLGRKC